MTTVVEYHIPEKTRKKTLKTLSPYFNKKQCVRVEQGFYDFTEQFCKSSNNNILMAKAIYEDNVKNFIFNCEQNNVTIQELIESTKQNKCNPYNFAFLTPYELDKDNWIKIILRRTTTEEKLNNLPTIEWCPCKICKMTEYFYYQLQTRSADEPMTTFYICRNCDKTYKINN